MRYPNEDEPSALPWIEDDESVEDALRDVVISHEGEHEKEEPEDGDGDNGGNGDSPRRHRGRAA